MPKIHLTKNSECSRKISDYKYLLHGIYFQIQQSRKVPHKNVWLAWVPYKSKVIPKNLNYSPHNTRKNSIYKV